MINDYELINFDEVKDSIRFFPKWASHDPYQILGFINLMLYVNKKNPNISSILELGSHIGETTNMLLGFPNLKNIYCVDDYSVGEIKKKFLKRMFQFIYNKKIFVINKPIKDAFDIFKNKKFDLIYIDSPEYLRDNSNLDLWKDLLNENGFLCGHDYENNVWKETLLSIENFKEKNIKYFKPLKIFEDTSWCFEKM